MVTAKRKSSANRRPDDYQIKNTRSRIHDDRRRAKAPGKRTSKTGRVYYERRENRSDIKSEVDAYERYVKAREALRKRKEATIAATKSETAKVKVGTAKKSTAKKRTSRKGRRVGKTTQATL